MATSSQRRGAFWRSPQQSLSGLLSRAVSALLSFVVGTAIAFSGALLLLTGLLLAQQAWSSSLPLPQRLARTLAFLSRSFAVLAQAAEPAP